MKLSNETIQVLENFAMINRGILIKPGTRLRTIGAQGGVAASADIAEEFVRDVPIADISSFLNALDLFKEPPELAFEDAITIADPQNRTYVRFYYANPKLIKSPPDGDVHLNPAQIVFNLTEPIHAGLKKACQILKKPELRFMAENDLIKIATFDQKDEHSNTYTVEVEARTNGHSCDQIFTVSNMRLIDGAYKVSLTERVAHFEHVGAYAVNYWVGPDANSKFTKVQAA